MICIAPKSQRKSGHVSVCILLQHSIMQGGHAFGSVTGLSVCLWVSQKVANDFSLKFSGRQAFGQNRSIRFGGWSDFGSGSRKFIFAFNTAKESFSSVLQKMIFTFEITQLLFSGTRAQYNFWSVFGYRRNLEDKRYAVRSTVPLPPCLAA